MNTSQILTYLNHIRTLYELSTIMLPKFKEETDMIFLLY